MENLPTEITENILFRLPIEVALQAKRVCKTWKSLLRNYKSDKPGFLFAFYGARKYDHYFVDGQPLLYRDDYDHYDRHSSDKTVSKMKHSRFMTFSQPYYTDILVGSCNGLACIGHRKDYPILFICNPLTGETIVFPLEPSTRYEFSIYRSVLARGFGYCPSTNVYKVVTIIYDKVVNKGHVQVYTVGSGEWRCIESTVRCSFSKSLSGVYANGALYWLNQIGRRARDFEVLAFDLESEKFLSIPLPHPHSKYIVSSSELKLLGGNDNLYLSYINYKAACTDIWVYRRNNNTTIGTSCGTESLLGWIKELSIEGYSYYHPIAITRNNEIVLRCTHDWLVIPCTRLYCYDSKTRSLSSMLDDHNPKIMRHIDAIPHTHSLVSLKELGETDVIN